MARAWHITTNRLRTEGPDPTMSGDLRPDRHTSEMTLRRDTRRSAGLVAVVAAVACIASLSITRHDHGDTSLAAAPLPQVRLAISDLTYRGAFRLPSDTFGESSTNYAVGTLAHHAANDSIFIAGHAQHNAVGEFAIPTPIGTGNDVDDLPVAESLQPFAAFLGDAPTGNPDGIDRINGLHVDDGSLIVNAERWYDAAGTAVDTTLVLDADDLDGDVSGYFELDGRTHAGGYMSDVPDEWRDALGNRLLTGWASNTSIISRHSIGPTLFTFDPDDLIDRDAMINPTISTDVHMDFPYAGQRWITPDALDTQPGSASPLWNHLSRARYGFIAPGTSTFVVLGSTGGVDSGIGYKFTQDNDNLCGGYCAYAADDYSNAYWLFDVNDILTADDVHLPQPYAYGEWSVPFDDGGRHGIIGGSFDPATSTLYLALDGAGQVGTYDRPPLVVVFDVPTTPNGFSITELASALRRAERVD
jgi:hypothetical protein